MKDAHSLEAAVQWMEDLAKCTEKEMVEELVELNQAISLEARTRLDIAGRLENYTCTDPHAPASPDISSHVWAHSDGNNRMVHVKHSRATSKIHVIDHFIDKEECAAMEKAAEPHLHTATVADGKGGSKVSDHRRAKQAGIRVPWHNEKNGDPIARLSRRVYDYANYALGLNIDEEGQEDLMSIQYVGRGKDDEHPDRYMPVSTCILDIDSFLFLATQGAHVQRPFPPPSTCSIAMGTALASRITMAPGWQQWLCIAQFLLLEGRRISATPVSTSSQSWVTLFFSATWIQRQGLLTIDSPSTVGVQFMKERRRL